MTHAIVNRLRRFTIIWSKYAKKKVGGGDKEPKITEGRAVNIAWSDCSTVTLRAVKQKDEDKFCLCVCTVLSVGGARRGSTTSNTYPPDHQHLWPGGIRPRHTPAVREGSREPGCYRFESQLMFLWGVSPAKPYPCKAVRTLYVGGSGFARQTASSVSHIQESLSVSLLRFRKRQKCN